MSRLSIRARGLLVGLLIASGSHHWLQAAERISIDPPLSWKYLAVTDIDLEQFGSNAQLPNGSDAKILAQIWHDDFVKEAEIRQNLSKITKRPPILKKNVYYATFALPGSTIIISTTSTPDQDCHSYENIGLSAQLISCPMKVGLIEGTSIKTIFQKSDYAFSIPVSENGSLPEKILNTAVVFDPKNKTISTYPATNWIPVAGQSFLRQTDKNLEKDNSVIALKL